MFEMKEQEKEGNNLETSNVPEKEFITVVTKIFNGLRRRIDKLSENFNKGSENIKK